MSRQLIPGTKLNEIAGSLLRYPGFRVLVWNPVRNTMGEVVTGTSEAPLELTAYVDEVTVEENIGQENAENPSPSHASITFRKNLPVGAFRRGWIADGVIVRILEGDGRVRDTDWTCIFTGTFRGRPGENTGSRSDLSEGLTANAFGREERYMSSAPITTDPFPAGTDLGEIAYSIAWKHMGLGQDEILFGALGFRTQHITNQIADLAPLDALYQCMFPVGKKPKFDSLGRLTAVDTNLDKPAVRIYSAGDLMIEKLVATPNDIEVNNQVLLRGLDHNKTRVIQDFQVLDTLDLTTGFFDASVNREVFFSADHTQKAQDTYVVARHAIKWSKAEWAQVDEFRGRLSIDTHYLRNVREIIFGAYLALQVAIIALDYYFQSTSGAAAVVISVFGINITVATLRATLQTTAQLALAALLWSMNYIGRGEYEVWGKPFEYVFQELVSDNRLVGLDPEELRAYDYRNDFISQIDDLDRIGREMLRRELLKNQLYDISILSDPLIEVDDVIETASGSRYYTLTVSKTLKRGAKPSMGLTAWKVFEDFSRNKQPITATGVPKGYGVLYGDYYGEAF